MHADSGRQTVESYFSQATALANRDGYKGRLFRDSDPKAYVSAWPQFSKKLLLAKGLDPGKIHLDFRADKWVVVSSTPREVAVVTIFEDFFREPPKNTNEDVGYYHVFETKLEPGAGWKIVVDSKGGQSADFKFGERLSWREYVSRGYKDKIDSVYSGQASDRGRRESESQQGQTSQLCEAQKKTCLAGCGDPSYWNGSRFVDRQSWSGCQSRCGSIACN